MNAVMFAFEAVVKAFGDLLEVKAGAHPAGDIENGQILFFLEFKHGNLQTLQQSLAGLTHGYNRTPCPPWVCLAPAAPTAIFGCCDRHC